MIVSRNTFRLMKPFLNCTDMQCKWICMKHRNEIFLKSNWKIPFIIFSEFAWTYQFQHSKHEFRHRHLNRKPMFEISMMEIENAFSATKCSETLPVPCSTCEHFLFSRDFTSVPSIAKEIFEWLKWRFKLYVSKFSFSTKSCECKITRGYICKIFISNSFIFQ